ncbi:MAG: four-carbon acid sugar kinase family protein [Thermodesulfobacteriota bacterium]|nr:four-carbon acid sugar kinase family protein [Thermodesulfobacteriota bacterium]
MTSKILEFAVIADDLTGSLDTGLQFRKKGLSTFVPLRQSARPNGQVLVLNTDSRNLSGDLAYKMVYKTCRSLKARVIYKKIDSTMRGNVGKEALAILDAQKIPKAIVVPTIPVLGRTVEKGILRIHGVPLLRTSYARDPFHPLWTSRIPDLLQKETGLPAGHIPLRQVRKNPAYLAEQIEKSQERLLSVDAVLQSDLQTIAAAWKLLSGKVLASGSVGLADEIVSSLPEKRKVRGRVIRGPLLIVSASRNPTTAEQIKAAQEKLCLPLFEPDLDRLTNPRWARVESMAIAKSLSEILFKSPGAILTTTFQRHIPGKERTISQALGIVTVSLLKKVRLGGLVLTGGDLAMGVCERLSATALGIEDEVLPGIPCSTLTDGLFKGLRLVTKAGGFGDKEALWRIMQYLRGEYESPKT